MHIRKARFDEAGIVAAVLSSAASALVQKGEALWSAAEVSEATVKEHVRSGMYYVAFEDQCSMGVFRFQLEDRSFWPDVPEGASAFVHKLAVCPEQQGQNIAHALLGHACELTRQHGRRYLRLDCMSGRPKLRAVYERFGFRHHSEKKLGNQLFDRFEIDLGGADA
jgi:GNAT superfamily N-acetyltransferase